jgi:PAS domain S-box-containing protein
MGSSDTSGFPEASSRRPSADKTKKERDILQAVVEIAGALIIVLNRNGEIVFFNKACEKASGYSAGEVKGRKPWTLLVAREQVAEVKAIFAGLIAGSSAIKHEHIWEARDGKRRLVAWTNTALLDGGGQVEYIIAAGLDITDRRAADDELHQRTRELGGRVKELNCLYNISRLREQPGLTLGGILQQVVEIIPPSWGYPEIACARIILHGKAYASSNFKETRWKQSSMVKASGEQVGMVDVFYLEQRPVQDEGPFCAEERSLLNAIAERLGRVIEHKESEVKLHEYQQQLRHLASELSLAEERDRRRFAQELHDRIGQLLAVAKIKLAKLLSAKADKQLSEIMEMIEVAIQEARALTFELSPPVLQELGFEAALEWLVSKFQSQHGITATFKDDQAPKALSDDLQVVLFQAVRELLHNAAKYSQASRVTVITSSQDNRVLIEVSDDGIGFNARAVLDKRRKDGGFGLFSIRERLGHFGGTMQITSIAKRGAHITLAAPLELEGAVADYSAVRTVRHLTHDGIGVLLVDDHQITRQGIRSLLEECSDIVIIAEAGGGAEAVKLARKHLPDVVVMDAAMPDMNGIEATRQITAEHPEIKVVALSMHDESQYVLEMLRAGASGYLLKDCAQEDLAQAIRAVHSQLTFFSPGIAHSVVQNYLQQSSQHDSAIDELTPREQEVLMLLTEGLQTKQIASRCNISAKTVESHRQHIMEKLDLHSVAKLTKYAIRKGLTSLEP